MAISIHKDPDFEWIIEITYHEELYPSIGDKLRLFLNTEEFECEVLNVVKIRSTGIYQDSKGKIHAKLGPTDVRIIKCSQSPNAIGKWFCHYFDLKAIDKWHLSIDRSGGPNDGCYYIFIEKLSENQFRLVPDFHQYRDFIRNRLAP